MTVEHCRFETARLRVGPWHAAAATEELDLPAVVAAMLSPAVTHALPPGWQGLYTRARAEAWIAARDDEATTLLVLEPHGAGPVGLVILFELPGPDGVELRLGYLLAQHAWGRGLATELLRGLIGWCAQRPVCAVVGGVAQDNIASQRVLVRSGFILEKDRSDTPSGELLYRWEPQYTASPP